MKKERVIATIKTINEKVVVFGAFKSQERENVAISTEVYDRLA